MTDPFIRELARLQQAETEGEDLREEATRRMAPGVEVVDVLADRPLTPSEEARVQAASKAIRFARLRQVGERLKRAGKMPARLSRG